MTFREAVASLDGEGRYGAKRPSMTGYAAKIAAEDGSVRVVVKGRGDACVEFSLADGAAVGFADGSVSLTAGQFAAFVFANDWMVADAAELEKARVGAGAM